MAGARRVAPLDLGARRHTRRAMADETEPACPDCGGEMSPIHIIDKGHRHGQYPLEYRLPDAKQSLWTGRFPIAGSIGASMCGACGRIVFRGIPSEPRDS